MSINIGPASDEDLRPKIMVVGVGGAGGNAIANMMQAEIEGVDFIDSTGLGVLVGAVRRARSADGDVRLVCTNSRLLKVFDVTGLDEVFTIVESVDDAVAAGADGR